MKRIYLLLTICLFSASLLMAQTAVKPTIMVVPDDNWCKKMGYVREDGSVDYEKALMNEDIKGSMIVMHDYLADVGYPMESLQEKLNDLHTEEAIDLVGVSRNDADIMEDDLDKLLRSVNADIMVRLAVNNEAYGPRRIIKFQLESVDAASRKVIHGNIGSSTPSNAPASSLIMESVASFIDNFLNKIDMHFANMAEKGRESTLIFKVASDCPVNLEDYVSIPGVGEGELRDYLEYWLSERTVDGAPRAGDSSRVRAVYSQVRIPLFGTTTTGFGNKGKMQALTAEKFIKDIVPDLRRLGISARVIPQGIGKATIILGAN